MLQNKLERSGIDAEGELRRLYNDKRMSGTVIAKKFGVGVSTVYQWLRKYGIGRRDRSEANTLAKRDLRKIQSAGELRELYWGQEMSIYGIGELLKCHPQTVVKWMRKLDIPRRSISEANIRKVSLKPTGKLGYFCGLVMGDGSIGEYEIRLGSNYIEAPQTFYDVSTDLFPELHINLEEASSDKDLFPYKTRVYSKALADSLRPFKPEPYRWHIPDFLDNDEALAGFLAGILDSDGCISERKRKTFPYIMIRSKFRDGLDELEEVCKNFDIHSAVYHSNDFCFQIHRKESVLKFLRLAHPYLRIKKEKAVPHVS